MKTIKVWVAVYLDGDKGDSWIGDVEVYTEQPSDGIYRNARGVVVYEKEIQVKVND